MSTQVLSSLISSVGKSRETILKQMEYLGYDVKKYKDFSIYDVNAMMQNSQLDMLIEKSEADKQTGVKKRVYIKYYLGKTLNQTIIQTMIDELFVYDDDVNYLRKQYDTLYIIFKSELNEATMNLLKHIWENEGIYIVVQNIKRLQFNILEHNSVFPHRLMDTFEVEEIKSKYNIIDNTQFPEISRFDPVAQVICLRPGEVCEITRSSNTAIVSKYYRICI